jgi:hypothetical protein
MPATYEPIATTTLGSAAATITFSSIPSTYTDLRLVLVARNATSNNDYFRMRLNSATTNYSATIIRGDGSAVASTRDTNSDAFYINYYTTSLGTGIFSFVAIDLFSYAGSTNKSVLIDSNSDNNGSGRVQRQVGLYRSTSAITSITIDAGGTDNLQTGTTATLYGIKNA